ncbi:unnamed protein product [Symbiodinium microadriaticum]|nr:unnamed protein product [Symbiodinium microadriaticum]
MSSVEHYTVQQPTPAKAKKALACAEHSPLPLISDWMADSRDSTLLAHPGSPSQGQSNDTEEGLHQVKQLEQQIMDASKDVLRPHMLAQVLQLMDSTGGRVPLKGEVDRARALVTAARRTIRRVACWSSDDRVELHGTRRDSTQGSATLPAPHSPNPNPGPPQPSSARNAAATDRLAASAAAALGECKADARRGHMYLQGSCASFSRSPPCSEVSGASGPWTPWKQGLQRSCQWLAGATPVAFVLAASLRRSVRRRQGSEQAVAVADVEEELTDGDYCSLALIDTDEEDQWNKVSLDSNKRLRDTSLAVINYVLPIVGPAVAFWQWSNILQLTHRVLGDERQLLELMQVTLTPATNGIVIASLSIAFGTLTSLTISSLRQRQKEIRQYLNKEACEMRILQAMLLASYRQAEAPIMRDGPGGNAREAFMCLRCLELLNLYAARVYSESTSEVDLSALKRQIVPDTEMLGILDYLSVAMTSPTFSAMSLRDNVAMSVSRLNDFRSERLSSINTAFPFLHWVILSLLASSISICFLIEVDQSEGRFLAERPEDSMRLRLVFTMLVGSFCGLTALCADLNDLFRGSFNVNESAVQMSVVQEVIRLENSQLRTVLEEAIKHLQPPQILLEEASRNFFWDSSQSEVDTGALSALREELAEAEGWEKVRRELLVRAVRRGAQLEEALSTSKDETTRKDVIIYNLRQEMSGVQQELKQTQGQFESHVNQLQQQHLQQLQQQACQIQELQLLQIQRLRQWLVLKVSSDGATVDLLRPHLEQR